MLPCTFCQAADGGHILWSIGKADHSTADLALGPDKYNSYLEADFGFEDRYFLIGKDTASRSFPYVIPGPADEWGGTWSTAGWRTRESNILFGLDNIPAQGTWKLIIVVADNAVKKPPLLKVSINNLSQKFQLPAGASDLSIAGKLQSTSGRTLEIPIPGETLKKGGNSITLSVLEGSWILFDHIRLEAPAGTRLTPPEPVFIRNTEVADYEILRDGKNFQPFLADMEHLEGTPRISFRLDGKEIYSQLLDTARYLLEIPMSAVKKAVTSNYQLMCNGKVLQQGKVNRSPQPLQTPAGYVDTRIGTAHSRWMIAPGPWMPFGMVKLSPDNQNAGWQAGYQPTF